MPAAAITPLPGGLQAPTYRACELCRHALQREGARLCGRGTGPLARAIGVAIVPVSVARSPFGACGPQAEHMDMPAWHS